MHKKFSSFLLFFLFLISLIPLQSAVAISCTLNFEQKFDSSEAIFIGKVLAKDKISDDGKLYNVTFGLYENFKGNFTDKINITATILSMTNTMDEFGEPFQIGKKYLVYADLNGDVLMSEYVTCGFVFSDIFIPQIKKLANLPESTISKNISQISELIKNESRWWVEGYDVDPFLIIYNLIDDGVIEWPNSNVMFPEQNLPEWLKNNAWWWSNDMISDQDFANCIQYLLDHSIIRL